MNEQETAPTWRGREMQNRRMFEQLVAGECLDLNDCVRTPDGDYILDDRHHVNGEYTGTDFCNAETEQWIWSIGRHLETGVVIASHSNWLYQHPEFECVWLR